MSIPAGARSPGRTGARFGATAATLVLLFATIQLVGASFAGAAGPAQLEPIVNNQVGGLQGLLAGGNPNVSSDWTPGNLCAGNGTCYHELDNVPHRIFLNGLTSGTTYEFTILADTLNSGTHGYDNINTPSAISGVTGGSGGITLTQNPNTTSGCGSTTCISYTFSFVASGTDAEIRFNVHLAIGSHLFNGSSLGTRVLGTARNVPLPVKEILFQQLAANVVISKEARNLAGAKITTVSPGQQFTYVIQVANTGSAAASNVTVTDNLNDDLAITAIDFDNNPGSAGGTGSCLPAGAGNTVSCNVGTLAASDGNNTGSEPDVATVTISVTAPTGKCINLDNKAEVTWQGFTGTKPSASTSLSITCPPVNAPDVKVTKSASTAQVNSGGSVTYTLVASNVGGSGTATNVTITDTIPAGLTITGTTGPCVVTGQAVTCNVGSLAPGASASVTITVQATDAACPEVSNFASVKADNEAVANTGNNVSNSVKVNVTCPSPDVKVEKQDDVTAGGVASGGQFTYTVTATNLGGSVATDVNINDTIPAGLTIVSASNGCTISGQDVTCALGNLAAGASASVTITVQATDGACPEVVNHATVTAGNEPAGNHGNNTSNDVTTLVNCVSPGVAVRIAKTNDADGDGHYTNSEEAKRSGLDVPFRLEIVNTGTVDATITDLTDAFDQQTIDLLNTKCADLSGTTLAAGETVVCKFTMNNYSPPAASGSLVNTARICVENAAGDTTDCNVDDSSVRSAEVLGKTVTPTPTITATPPGATAFTGSNGALAFGLFALFLLMIGSGMTYLGYRRRARFDG
jgi:uncharacterized repeat protein (TIGR01451 family)